MKLAIVIQARKGSSRLPGKMALPFYNDQTLLEVILEKLKKVGEKKGVEVILATTICSKDDELVSLAKNSGVEIIRGSEEDVLSRFILAADQFELHKVIRVCGDNPFILTTEIESLIDKYSGADNVDYMSYRVNGKPSILTHFGLWTEAVDVSALRKVASMTEESLYHEHVTNFIYAHPEIFKLEWIVLNDVRFADENIRLTIDTENDFKLVSQIFQELNAADKEVGFGELHEFVKGRPDMLKMMKSEIEKNSK